MSSLANDVFSGSAARSTGSPIRRMPSTRSAVNCGAAAGAGATLLTIVLMILNRDHVRQAALDGAREVLLGAFLGSPEESTTFVDTCLRHIDGRVPAIVDIMRRDSLGHRSGRCRR